MDYKYIQIMSLIVYTAVTTRLKFPVKDYIRIKHLKSEISSCIYGLIDLLKYSQLILKSGGVDSAIINLCIELDRLTVIIPTDGLDLEITSPCSQTFQLSFQ